MEKVFKLMLLIFAAITLPCTITSCSDNDNDDNSQSASERQAAMANIGEQYISSTVQNTYGYLATYTGNLYDELNAAITKYDTGTLTQNDIDQICSTFKTARSYYESSEAFLFGAATDFGIDPHIDTWPLDVNALATTLKNSELVEKLKGEDGIAWAASNLGQGCLGFHGIEFVLFRNGGKRKRQGLYQYRCRCHR